MSDSAGLIIREEAAAIAQAVAPQLKEECAVQKGLYAN